MIPAISALSSNPLILFFFQQTTIALLAGFTHPSSFLRVLFFPILIAWNVYVLPHYKDHLPTTVIIVVLGFGNLGQILSYWDQLLLKRWNIDNFEAAENKTRNSFDKQQHSSTSSISPSLWRRLCFGTWLAFSTRYIGTAHCTSNTPPYSTRNPSYIPTRTAFLARKLLIFIACYLIVDILTQGNQPARNPILYADTKIPLFTRLFSTNNNDPNNTITVEELFVRVITTLAFWASSYFMLQVMFGSPQLLTVALHLSCPEQERPLLGSVGEAYTLRGFWGSFWHQMLRCRLTAVADWVTYDVLKLPRSEPGRASGSDERASRSGGGWVSPSRRRLSRLTSQTCISWQRAPTVPYERLVARYTHLMCAFCLSGLLHHLIDVAQGHQWTDSGAAQCFVLMGVGIMAEDAAQWVWFDGLWGRGKGREEMNGGHEDGKSLNGGGVEKSPKRPSTWATRLVGYLWVATWLSVATPWYIYPSMSRNTGGPRDQILPFSVVGYLLRTWA